MTYESIKKRYDSRDDPHAKKNRDSNAATLREQGYNVSCGRETSLQGYDVYFLHADRNIGEKQEESVHV